MMHSGRTRTLGALGLIAGLAVPVCVATTATAAVPTLVDPAQILEAHNAARAEVGTAPLEWSSTLEASAQQWADHLAEIHGLEHSGPGGSGHGENLWMGTRDVFSDAQKITFWTAEETFFVPGQTFPDVSNTGNWEDVGHYTQMVWYDTTAIGCGVASDDENDYLVCHYDPPGNVEGEYPLGHP
ncbi:CAP domain-containing protein [Geodermatophilus sp. SYSU D00965]